MATVLLSIEGVLTEDLPHGADLLHYDSSVQGKTLYTMLQPTTRLVLFSADPNKDRVKAWMARERFGHYADIRCYPNDSLLTPPLWRIQHLRELMGAGHHIAFYIDSDPAAVGMALEAGVGGILVARPGENPGDRDDMTFTPWFDLVDTIEAQNMLRATKAVEAQDG